MPLSKQSVPSRSTCRGCGNTGVVLVMDLGAMPPANKLCGTANEAEQLAQFPLVMGQCVSCGLAQLMYDCQPEELFSDYPYFSSFSTTWLQHAEQFAKSTIPKLQLSQRSLVVEIASNDGYLLQYFKKAGCQVLGIDPAESVVEAATLKGVETLQKFFDESQAIELRAERGQADLIVANNVLAHVPDPTGFLRGVAHLLAAEGVFSCEFPSLSNLVDSAAFDTIYHEHFSYFSLSAAKNIFDQAGLKIFEVQSLPTHGGSLRVWASLLSANREIHPSVRTVFKDEAIRLIAEPRGLRTIDRDARYARDGLRQFLYDQVAARKTVMGYGAAAKGLTFLNYANISPDLLPAIADLNPAKQGRFTPMNAIPIVPVEELLATQPDYVVVLPWNLRAEISQQLSCVRDWGGKFVVAVPKLEIF